MVKIIKCITLVSVVSFALVACQKHSPESFEPLPGISVPTESFNTEIKLIDDPSLRNSHKNGELLLIRIMNTSNNTIIFGENYSIKLFTKENDIWTETLNNAYNAGEIFYLPTNVSYPLGLLVSVGPYIPNLDSPAIIRMVVVGYEDGNESKLIAAYIDIVITP